LVAFVVLATWYSVTVPLGEAPDEVPHFTYIRYLAQHGRLPTTGEEHEAFQPPLYYAAGAALTFWIEDRSDAPFAVRANANFDVADARAPKNLLLHTADEAWPYRGWALAWHVVRLLSIALGAVTVYAIYRLGGVLFSQRPAVPLGMAALAAFTPQFLFVSAVVNNDNAATAFSALILWRVAALLRESAVQAATAAAQARGQAVWKGSAGLGLLLGLGLLSKANLIALVPVAGVAIMIAGSQAPRGLRLRRALGGLAVTFGLAVLLAGWYFLRNWVLHGDPMGWSFLLEINARRAGPLTAEVLAWLFRGVFRSFWLGWIGIAFEGWIYWALGAGCLVGVAGFVVWLACRRHELEGWTRWTLALLGLHAAITVGSLIQWTATVLGTDQGRLIYPILPTVMLVLAAGWAWWARKAVGKGLLAGAMAGMFLLAVLTPVRYLAPVYAPAPVATEAELAAANPLGSDWEGIRLLGYRLESNQVQPGDKLVLHLYWQAGRPVESDIMALIQLVDQDDKFLMYSDGSPTAGRDTTDRWQPGIPLASRHLLPVPDYGRPGEYRLTVSLHPFGEATWLPVRGADGVLLGDRLILPETIHLVSP